MAPIDVQLDIQENYVVLDNGIVKVTLSKPQGLITQIQYGGLDNVLEVLNQESNRGYWDLVWNSAGGRGTFDVIQGTAFSVVTHDEDTVEVSFMRNWSPDQEGSVVPLIIDKRFIVRRGSSGFYTYAIYQRPEGWPQFELAETRIAFKLRKDKFHYMAISDTRQREMPLPDDRQPSRCQTLAYAEAVLLTNPIEEDLKGEVDDKYQYSCDNKDSKVHGWISSDAMVGFWMITPSNEFRNGGPLKQNLTSHVGPTTLAVFHSGHYAGDDLVAKFEEGETWEKVFGPVFLYLNSGTPDDDRSMLWEDAKLQMNLQVCSWPYDFPASASFPKQQERGSVIGRLLVYDPFVGNEATPASHAYVGLAFPGESGSWQRESKGYQFWTMTDADGLFVIKNVRCGDYNLYGWVPGVIGDYKNDSVITITPGWQQNVGELTFIPPRDGPTLWEIGISTRTAEEFYIPDPPALYVNKLYLNHLDRWRQYGLWEKYVDLYPINDLVYTIGSDDYGKDWFFAHVPRKTQDGKYMPTTWQIKFKLDQVINDGTYKLRIAVAASSLASIQVRFNDPKVIPAHFESTRFGQDNAIARHGIHGLYWLFNVDVNPSWLLEGDNTMFLTQPRGGSPFVGILYDYLRLEAPAAALR